MKIFRLLMNVLLTGVTFLFILIGILNYFSAPESSGIFGYKGYIVTSGSMEPAFSPGDYVIVREEAFESLESGDVISFTSEETIVTHRIAEKTAGGLVTRGDANNAKDAATVTADHYIGTLRTVLPGFGQVVLFLQKPYLFPVLLFVTGAYLLFLYYYGEERPREAGATRESN